jgi:hypothetical protein
LIEDQEKQPKPIFATPSGIEIELINLQFWKQ